ncbi:MULTISPECIES: hypothetical protein [Curtobacterium]|uniref:hypothetical protein n=1 Tax=Curtobacterium TaxID=2034 RepID=UPI001BDE541C|nr:hypothetical protein [Curtobacterium flaccumfaciens]MBT1611891.1 hypothetical protein [Curtobacterium flaccumfaciens pv. poinsettiae]MCS5524841.1 hypothetical protein [Curtobacterium flaccumfaciens pv. oortii]
MDFSEVLLKVIGNLVVLVLVVRLFFAWLRRGYAEMISEIVAAIVIFGFINFPDQTVTIFTWVWQHTIVEWFSGK